MGLSAAIGVALLAPSAPVFADPAPAASTDVCADIQPDVASTTAPSPTTATPGANREVIKGLQRFNLDGLMRPAFKMVGKEFPEGELMPSVRLLDDTIQGQGKPGQKTALKSGLVCAVTASLVDFKVRRDVAERAATALLAAPTLLAGLEGPDIAAFAQTGVGCAVKIGQAAAAAAMSGASAGGAAAAAAPQGIAAIPICVAAGGDAARIFGKVLNVWEHNPAMPQLVEFSELLNPDSPIGAKVWSKLPKFLTEGTVGALNKGLMKSLSRFVFKLSEVYFGKSISIIGDAVSKSASGDTSAVPGAALTAVELGIQVVSATVYTVTGSDELKFAGETVVDTKQLVNRLSKIYSKGLTRFPGEGREVVDQSGLGGTGTTQQLQELNLGTLTKPIEGPVGCIMGVNGGASGMTTAAMNSYQTGSVQQAAATTQTIVPTQPQAGAGTATVPQVTAPQVTVPQATVPTVPQVGGSATIPQAPAVPQAGTGVATIPQFSVPQASTGTQQQGVQQAASYCANGQRVSIDNKKMLTQAEIDELKKVPGAWKAPTPPLPGDGALFGLDGNSLLSSIPIIGQGAGQGQGGGNTGGSGQGGDTGQGGGGTGGGLGLPQLPTFPFPFQLPGFPS
ncbi:hypothetical protein AXK57_22035 [Tsukamurella pulmonis]|uniref:hypothetical protein n=1 Tax=Tsukamurella pulmonis TaxID=47312 RepID=UPI0007976256|nr:hypothetical protein [Tsukamurella pulmonis]KXP11556.1 hypothetical protein AXK57_22035 [Tsukamurella pulmonis]